MLGDLISIDSALHPIERSGLAIDSLLGCNYVYQKIHTSGHRPLHPAVHCHIIGLSCKSLYGFDLELSAEQLNREVETLLRENRYGISDCQVNLYMMPDHDSGQFRRLINCEKQLLYKGYTFWHKNLNALILPYEYPFHEHKTAVSLSAHDYARHYAQAKGFDAAIAENRDGILTGVGEYPIFAVSGNRVTTPSVRCGAAESVERRLVVAAAARAGFRVAEESVESKRITGYDELFTAGTQGIVSIGRCRGKLFTDSAARVISGFLGEVPEAELL